MPDLIAPLFHRSSPLCPRPFCGAAWGANGTTERLERNLFDAMHPQRAPRSTLVRTRLKVRSTRRAWFTPPGCPGAP
eukprot:3165629-Pyramimonas_sp.AAC.1